MFKKVNLSKSGNR